MVLRKSFLKRPIAHRGYHGKEVTENSRAAFDAAISRGFGIELDVQALIDGCPVVFHDDFLDRLTNRSGKVRNLRPKDIERVCLNNGEPLPTLKEILALVNGKVPIFLEIKDQDGALGENLGKLVEKTAHLINTYEGEVAIMSFNPFVVNALTHYCPKIPRGLVTDDFFSEDWSFLRAETKESLNKMEFSKNIKIDFISHNVKKIRSPQINIARKKALPVICWTVRSKNQEEKARKTFDNITFEGYLPK